MEVVIHMGSMIAHRDTSIGAGSVIGPYCIIGLADLGTNVVFGSGVSVLSGKYQHGRPGERAAGESTEDTYERVSIGSDTWVGDSAIVLASVGERCTVGAGAVVFKDFPDESTVLGNPARKVNM